MREEEPICISKRALDILAVLIERAGEVVTKRELFALVWPDTVVEEGNIKVQIAKLRRALGDSDPDTGHIVTSHGRGYRFAEPVSVWDDNDGAASGTAIPTMLCNLPQQMGRPVGRDAVIARLSRSMLKRRMLTIAGPGGIGKTTVALAVAETVARGAAIEVCFVDLSRVTAPQFVACSLASALGLTVHSGDIPQAVLANLRTRRVLIVLDSCENVIDATAVLASRILADAPATILLATSREPLRIRGEHVHHLATLEVPGSDAPLLAAEALTYSAIQLFVERAAEAREDFQLSDADVPAVAEICRRLDGIALAIELAATRIDAFSPQELLSRLDDRFSLLQRGSRNAEARHRTLAAALDWSYAYLPEQEQAILRSMAVFAGSFTLDAAIAVLHNSRWDSATIIDGVSDLVAKSLVTADVSGAVVYYRLLDTSRAYALEKLDDCNETSFLRYQHAEHQLDRLQRATDNGTFTSSGHGSVDDARWVEDVRCALAWAFAPGGNIALGVDLTIAAIPMWMHLSLLDECLHAATRALYWNNIENCAAPCGVLQLYTALGGASMHSCGPSAETGQAWTRALELAEQLGDKEYQLRSLWGLAMYQGYVGDFGAVLALAERFRAIAHDTADHAASASVERLIGTAMHSLGDENAARHHLEKMLRMNCAGSSGDQIARFQVDQQVATRTVLANVLWVMGNLDSASRMMAEALHQAREAGHTLSILSALANAACLAVRSFADELAQNLLIELGGRLSTNANAVLDTMRRALSAILDLRRGNPMGFGDLFAALEDMRSSGFQYRYSIYLGMLAIELGAAGRQAEAIESVNQALAFAGGRQEGWCLAELWRIKGELLARSAPSSAEQCFMQARGIASSQNATLWSLRIAVSSARLWRGQDQWRERCAALRSVYETFDEGYGTVDLLVAKHLLDGPDCRVSLKMSSRSAVSPVTEG